MPPPSKTNDKGIEAKNTTTKMCAPNKTPLSMEDVTSSCDAMEEEEEEESTTRHVLDAALLREDGGDFFANARDVTVPWTLEKKKKKKEKERMTARRSRCLVVAVSIRKIHESFAKACANVRRLSLIGHAIQTCDALEPLRKLVNLYDLKLKRIDGQFANPVCDVPGYARIVCEDVCEGRLVYLDGVKVGGKEGTSMMERAVEKMRRDVLKHEMERKRNAEERNTRERFSQRDREEKYSESETISGVHYELPKEETERIKSLFRKFDAIYASANELQTRLRKSLCARTHPRERARAPVDETL